MKEDISIPLVWPNQPINTGSSGAVTGIGHAGIIMIDGDSGNTTFVEYGRYDSDFDGSPLAGGGAIRFVSLGNTPTQGRCLSR
jgi:hypothetical protein